MRLRRRLLGLCAVAGATAVLAASELIPLEALPAISTRLSRIAAQLSDSAALDAKNSAADPPILLMDEPFGALDPLTRTDLQREFLSLQQKLRKTVLFVTHDLHEALLLGTRIALLDEGRLVSCNTPEEFVASSEPLVKKYVDAFAADDVLKRRAIAGRVVVAPERIEQFGARLQHRRTCLRLVVKWHILGETIGPAR